MGTNPNEQHSQSLTSDDLQMLRDALRSPHGVYGGRRAAQLSGVPERTVYHWAATGVLVPDYSRERPKGWSYRDLVYLRLVAWLRSHNLPLTDVTSKVGEWRAYFETAVGDADTVIHADGIGVARGRFEIDELTGQAVFEPLVEYTARFDLLARPEDDRQPKRLWGPNLVRPTQYTAISPWILAGEPVVRGSRIRTGSLYALRAERGLTNADIVALYSYLEAAEVDDAIRLEHRLRRAAA
jgi:uncharacterized protein (DUF433 family)/DNA-binding transcriptional MerR regulator